MAYLITAGPIVQVPWKTRAGCQVRVRGSGAQLLVRPLDLPAKLPQVPRPEAAATPGSTASVARAQENERRQAFRQNHASAYESLFGEEPVADQSAEDNEAQDGGPGIVLNTPITCMGSLLPRTRRILGRTSLIAGLHPARLHQPLWSPPLLLLRPRPPLLGLTHPGLPRPPSLKHLVPVSAVRMCRFKPPPIRTGF